MANKRARHYWRNLILFGLCIFLVSVTIGIGYQSYRTAYAFLHPTKVHDNATPGNFGIPFQPIQLVTRDGLHLAAWYTPPQNGTVILLAHGWAARRSPALHSLLARHGYGVVSWDFRANGDSEGDLTTLGYYEELDAEAALDYALKQDGVKRVGALGQSMGAATLIRAAAQRQEIGALVSDSAFPAIEEMLDHAVPLAVARPFIRAFAEHETGLTASAVRPIDSVGKISPRPIFIIQGAADDFIPPDSAQRLYAAAGEPRSIWIVPGAWHTGAFEVAPAEYERRVIEFFDASLPAGAQK